jgi:hypothetical protein
VPSLLRRKASQSCPSRITDNKENSEFAGGIQDNVLTKPRTDSRFESHQPHKRNGLSKTRRAMRERAPFLAVTICYIEIAEPNGSSAVSRGAGDAGGSDCGVAGDFSRAASFSTT